MLTNCGFKVSKQKELIDKAVNQTPTPLKKNQWEHGTHLTC